MQADVHGGQGVVRSDIKHADALVHAVHVEDPGILPVKLGHWVQTVDDEK